MSKYDTIMKNIMYKELTYKMKERIIFRAQSTEHRAQSESAFYFDVDFYIKRTGITI